MIAENVTSSNAVSGQMWTRRRVTGAWSDWKTGGGLTNSEATQLRNIGTRTISNTQWGYLGAMDQDVATTDSPSFAGLSVDTNVLYVDATNTRIGVNTSSPQTQIDIRNTALAGLQIKSTNAQADIYLNADSGSAARIFMGHGNDFDEARIQYAPFANNMEFYTNARGTADVTISDGDLDVAGALSKGSGSFKIAHPLKPDTHDLVHSFVEGPQADNIYRGVTKLKSGYAEINIDENFNMTPGTFEALNRQIQCFTTNETGWELVRGRVEGAMLIIESKEPCDDEISWMVIGERQDGEIYRSSLTDENGRIIVEPRRETNG